ncbi:hypothetical protein BRC98_04975 [Halobacteriales archaeon QS_7_68_65]|nr:MAG: hypothetical protein BRC98_04975 [Halobacteriales archaeon QS_7_68_65]
MLRIVIVFGSVSWTASAAGRSGRSTTADATASDSMAGLVVARSPWPPVAAARTGAVATTRTQIATASPREANAILSYEIPTNG